MSDERSDWAFARTPRWIAGHLLVVLLVILFVLAGLWQWSRHREVSGRNDRIEARRELPVLGPGDLVDGAADEIEFRGAELTGEWDPSGQLAIRNRSFNGTPGCHVVTPLLVEAEGTGGTTGVLVTRGWVPLADCDDVGVSAHPPPTGTWTVAGLVRRSQTRGSLGARDSEDGVLRTLNRLDVERIAQQYDQDVAGVYVELAAAEPEDAPATPPTTDPAVVALPAPVPAPSLSDGPHLGYTFQWFGFALVALVGYPIVLRRQAVDPHGRGPRRARPTVRPPTPPEQRPPRPSDPPADRAPRESSRS